MFLKCSGVKRSEGFLEPDFDYAKEKEMWCFLDFLLPFLSFPCKTYCLLNAAIVSITSMRKRCVCQGACFTTNRFESGDSLLCNDNERWLFQTQQEKEFFTYFVMKHTQIDATVLEHSCTFMNMAMTPFCHTSEASWWGTQFMQNWCCQTTCHTLTCVLMKTEAIRCVKPQVMGASLPIITLLLLRTVTGMCQLVLFRQFLPSVFANATWLVALNLKLHQLAGVVTFCEGKKSRGKMGAKSSG